MFEMADQVNVLKFLRTLTCLTIPTKCGIRPMPFHKKKLVLTFYITERRTLEGANYYLTH